MLRIQRVEGGFQYNGQAILDSREKKMLDDIMAIMATLPEGTPAAIEVEGDVSARTATPVAPVANFADLPLLHGYHVLPCAKCGKPKRRHAWQIRRNGGKVYCSSECAWAANSKPRKRKAS